MGPQSSPLLLQAGSPLFCFGAAAFARRSKPSTAASDSKMANRKRRLGAFAVTALGKLAKIASPDTKQGLTKKSCGQEEAKPRNTNRTSIQDRYGMNGRKRMSARRFRAITLANLRDPAAATPKLDLEDGQLRRLKLANLADADSTDDRQRRNSTTERR